MKILLIGGASGLVNKLIVKLRKERHKVFLITGQRNKNIYFERVFERFNFPYEGESMRQIFHSVRPDVTIFMGAQDSNFNWQNVHQESVRYNASLTNLLMSYSTIGSGKFLYLSSSELYQGHYPDVITEDTPIAVKENAGFYQTALMNAEELCRVYRENLGKNVTTLRLDRVWSVPQSLAEVRDICAKMCLQAMKDNRIDFRENRSFTWLYETDAVEYIYRMVKAESLEHSLYQITSGNVITERQLAEKIAGVMGTDEAPITLAAAEHAEEATICSNELYSNELGLNFFCETDKVIAQTAAKMLKNKERLLQGTDKAGSGFKTFWKKIVSPFKILVPYIENLLCLVLVLLLSDLVGSGTFFSRLDFFLLYVLLFALVYGQRQATVSALLGTIGYMIQQMYLHSSFEVMVDYNTYVWIVQLFTVGLLVGYQHDQYYILRTEMDDTREYLSAKAEDIAEINQINVRVKESLESQIVNQSDGIGKIYSITSSLDRYLPEEVLFQAVDVLKKTVATQDVAIYNVGGGQYARLYTATSDLSRKLGNSIRLSDFADLYGTLQEGKVYINRDLRENYPMMAVAVKDGDAITAILMLWNIPFGSMTNNTANLLTVTSLLIQNAVVRAQRYLEALEEKRFSSRLGALETDAFSSLLKVYENAQAKDLTTYTLLRLEHEGPLPDGIGFELAKRLRQSDYVGMSDLGFLGILLANTDSKNAQVVIERLQANGYPTRIVEVPSE